MKRLLIQSFFLISTIGCVNQVLSASVDAYDAYKRTKNKSIGAQSVALTELYNAAISSRCVRIKVVQDPEFNVGKRPTLAKVRASILRKIATINDKQCEKIKEALHTEQQLHEQNCNLGHDVELHRVQELLENRNRALAEAQTNLVHERAALRLAREELVTAREQLVVEQNHVTSVGADIVAVRREGEEQIRRERERAQQAERREHAAQERIVAAERDIAALRDQLVIEQRHVTDRENELVALRHERDEQVQREHEHAQQLIVERDRQAELREHAAQERVIAMEREFVVLREQLTVAQHHATELENERATIHREAAVQMQGERDRLKEQYEHTAQERLDEFHRERDDLEQRLRVATNRAAEFDILRERLVNSEAAHRQVREAVDGLTERLAGLMREKGVAEDGRDAARETLNVVRLDLEKRLTEQAAQFVRVTQEKEQLENTLRSLRQDSLKLLFERGLRTLPWQFSEKRSTKTARTVEAPEIIGGLSFGRLGPSGAHLGLGSRGIAELANPRERMPTLLPFMHKDLMPGLLAAKVGSRSTAIGVPFVSARPVVKPLALGGSIADPFVDIKRGTEVLRGLPAELLNTPLVQQALALSASVVGKSPSEVSLSREHIAAIERILPQINVNGRIAIPDRALAPQSLVGSSTSVPVIADVGLIRSAKQALGRVFSGLAGITAHYPSVGHLLP